MVFSPDIMTFADGRAVNKENWAERRKEIIDILSREEYGYTPSAPDKVELRVTKTEPKHCAGHAYLEFADVCFDTPLGAYSFPIHSFIPTDGKKHPLIVMLNFRPDIYDRYYCAEEIIDRGFALSVINYTDVTSDDGDFENGMAAYYPRTPETGWGKIGMWSFAASRVVDCMINRPEIDSNNIGICGHSRLGKTALWCGAQDERFEFVLSNDSGCSGAAYDRVKKDGSETIEVITNRFPFWFCDNYKKYVGKANEKPFDQHFVIGAIAPRFVMVNSASLDNWADQYGEQLSVIGASPIFEEINGRGYNGVKRPAKVGERFINGNPAYALRDGTHFFSRNDWNNWFDFIEKHINE